jgi:hypothetical protein
MLGGVNTLVQAFSGVVVQNRNCLLADDGAGIYAGIHEMNGATGDFHTMVESLLPGFKTGKGRQQTRVDIHYAAFEGAEKIALEHTHETCEDDQIYFSGLQCGHKRSLGVFIELGAEFTRRNELGRKLSFSGMCQDAGGFYIAGDEGNVCGDFAGGGGVSNRDEV